MNTIRTALPLAAFLGALLPRAAAADSPGQTEAPPPPAAVAPDRAASADYRVSPRDLVQFQIFEEPDTLVLQRVSSSGAISIPLLGLVRVADRTLREIEETTQRAYVEHGYFIHPQVIVTVQAYAARSISVLGQVNHPEQISLPIEASHIGIMQAITLAEGFTRLARPDQVRVMRTVDGHEEQSLVNIEAYLASNGKMSDFQLRPDDIVFVPERVF